MSVFLFPGPENCPNRFCYWTILIWLSGQKKWGTRTGWKQYCNWTAILILSSSQIFRLNHQFGQEPSHIIVVNLKINIVEGLTVQMALQFGCWQWVHCHYQWWPHLCFWGSTLNIFSWIGTSFSSEVWEDVCGWRCRYMQLGSAMGKVDVSKHNDEMLAGYLLQI